jgi:hypothetical protein
VFGYPRTEAAFIASSAINKFVNADMVFLHEEEARVFIENQAFESGKS